MGKRSSHWLPLSSLPWNDEGVELGSTRIPEFTLMDPTIVNCSPWQTLVDNPAPGELLSARSVVLTPPRLTLLSPVPNSFQYFVPPTGPFYFRSNISRPLVLPTLDHEVTTGPRNVNGTFTLGFNTSPTTPHALLSFVVQASSVQLREKVHVCFGNATTGSNLTIYVGIVRIDIEDLCLFTTNRSQIR